MEARKPLAAASPVSPAVMQIIDGVRAELDGFAAQTTDLIASAIPAYGRAGDRALLEDLTAHIREVYRELLRNLAEGRTVTSDDLPFTRAHAARRVKGGISLKDFMHAFRTGHLGIWHAILDVAGDDAELREAALSIAADVIAAMNVAASTAAEAYLEVQQLLVAESDRVRRDLLEDLLAGRQPPAGPKLATAQAAGLSPLARFVVIAASPVGPPGADVELRSAATALARATGAPVSPLVVLRHQEIVIVRVVAERAAPPLVDSLLRARGVLRGEGLELAIGVSTVRQGFGDMAGAYEEACAALGCAAGVGGVLALSEIDPFEYLTLRADDTARRLIAPEIRVFLAEDAARGGALIDTLVAYAESDLNAKVAAELLGVHSNTTRYRLTRIEDRTGRNLRQLRDVLELLLAVKLMRGADGRTDV